MEEFRVGGKLFNHHHLLLGSPVSQTGIITNVVSNAYHLVNPISKTAGWWMTADDLSLAPTLYFGVPPH